MTTGGAAFVAAWDDAFNAAPEHAADLFTEDASYTDHRPLGWPPMQGRDAIREWFGTLATGGASIHARSRVVEDRPPLVVVEQEFRIVAGAADGGGEGEVSVWVLLRLEDGRSAELDLFGDLDAALAALDAAPA
jgi:hypothetical protein